MKGSYQDFSSGPQITPDTNKSQEKHSPAQTQAYITPKFDPNTGLPLSPSTLDATEKVPKVRFDPETGEKIINPTDQKTEKEPSIPVSPKKERSPEAENVKEPPRKDPDVEIFTVLEPDVRARLLNLPMESEDRIIIGRSFIYLSENQQRQYLTELERVNEPPGKDIENLIKIIKKLPIPTHQQEFLVDQLNYIPETDHQDFASALKPELVKIPEKLKPAPSQNEKEMPAPERKNTESPEKKKKKSPQQSKKKRLLSD